jgi:hypothetical protein
MYHYLTFSVEVTLDLEISPKQPLERLRVLQGTRRRAQLKPYVVETAEGLVEVADLFFEDGSASRCVPYSYFSFEG